MSEFLPMKTTTSDDMKDDPVSASGRESDDIIEPTDSAFIVDVDGLPILRAVFDVRRFQPDQVTNVM
jgi:hypothetical protein